MVKSKKLLSLFLAVVMVLSVFTVMASAYTRGEAEGSADIDLKYTVEKVDSLPATDAGSVAYTGENLYAVTAWMKSSKGVDILTTPFHYNKAHFAPITLSDGECTYPYGAGLDQDTYYTDMGEGANYLYTLGDFMNNTGMYKANGTAATTKALAKCIGIGSSNHDGVTVLSDFVSPDHPYYEKWGAGLPENTGVMYVQLNVAAKTKTAYLNTISGIETSTDWNRMVTVYFEKIADVDVNGDEFGVFTDDCYTVDGNYDASGASYFASATTYKAEVPTMNVVSNAVITPVNAKSSQVRFNGTEADGTGSANFDIRTRAYMTAADFNAICTSEENAIALAKEGKLEVGFVYTAGSFDLATAKAVATGTAADGYTKKTVSYIQSTGTEYVWTCLITSAAYEGAVTSLGYITVDGTTYYFGAGYATDFSTLYDTWYDDYTASLAA